MWSFYSRWKFFHCGQTSGKRKNLCFSLVSVRQSPLSSSLSHSDALTEKHSSGDSTVYQNPIGCHLVPCYRGQNKEGQTASEPLVSSPYPGGRAVVVHRGHVPRCPPQCPLVSFSWITGNGRSWSAEIMACSIIQENTPRLIFFILRILCTCSSGTELQEEHEETSMKAAGGNGREGLSYKAQEKHLIKPLKATRRIERWWR